MKKDLKRGQMGEEWLLYESGLLCPKQTIYRPAGKTGPDFWSDKYGFLELKTDFMERDTGNIFWEYWSVWEQRKYGGPWASRHKGIDTYIYMFWRNKQMYIWNDLMGLCVQLDSWILRHRPRRHRIPNSCYTTVGYAIPIKEIMDGN